MIQLDMKRDREIANEILRLIGEDPNSVRDFTITAELGKPLRIVVERFVRHPKPDAADVTETP